MGIIKKNNSCNRGLEWESGNRNLGGKFEHNLQEPSQQSQFSIIFVVK